jgi:hypothetical protein
MRAFLEEGTKSPILLVVYLKNGTMFDNLVDGYQSTHPFFQI